MSAVVANLVQLVELAPQHLRLEERRVTSRCTFRGFERLTEMAKQSLDVVSFDDQGSQLESATAFASLNVDLERAFEKLDPWAIARAMGGRLFAVRVLRVRCELRRRRRHDQSP
jgi:hypothetical protein